MTAGPGKYDDLCTEVREKANANGVIVVVFGGDKGNGFSCQADAATTAALPDVLERIAAQIRADTQQASDGNDEAEAHFMAHARENDRAANELASLETTKDRP